MGAEELELELEISSMLDYLSFEKAKEIGLKVGDTVKRAKGGINCGIKQGDTFVISELKKNGIYDEGGRGHNYRNCVH